MKTHLSYNLILPKYLRIVKKFGSRMTKTRAREGGASVFTALLSCFCILVPPSVRQKIPFRLRKGKAEGGFGGNSAFPLRNQIEDSPAVLLVKSRTPHKSFLFLLEEKIGRAQNEKSKEYFSVV